MFREIVGSDRAHQALLSFERELARSISSGLVTALPGTEDAIGQLAGLGLRIALITGFSPRIVVLDGRPPPPNVTARPLADILGTVREMAATLPSRESKCTPEECPPDWRRPCTPQVCRPDGRTVQSCNPECLPDSYCNPLCGPGACKPRI